MPQNITKSVFDFIDEANAATRQISIAEARDMHGRADVIFIDIRDVREIAKSGRIAGARHVPRGMLEFWIDPKSPYHKDFFAGDKTFVFYCAASWRSALAAKTAQDMGLAPVAHIDGGFNAWTEAGGPVEAPRSYPRAPPVFDAPAASAPRASPASSKSAQAKRRPPIA